MTTIPNTLNGYPVRATARLGMRDLVLVERAGHAVHPWVAATWDGNDGWHWGQYAATEQEARDFYPDAIWWD